jgi:uncharacterized protein DUF6069
MGLCVDPPAPSGPVWIRGLFGAAVAVLINVSIYVLARTTGVSIRLRGQPDVFETAQALTTGFRRVEVWNVILDSIVPFVLGTAAFGFAARRSRAAAVSVLVIGALVALLSATVWLTVRVSVSTSALLLAMHVVIGVTFVASLLAAVPVRRSRASDVAPR